MAFQALIASFIPWASKALNMANSVKKSLRGEADEHLTESQMPSRLLMLACFFPCMKLQGKVPSAKAEKNSKKMFLRCLAQFSSKQEILASPTH